MRTIVRSAIVTLIAFCAFLATPAAQPGQIISRFGGGWLVGAASDGSAVSIGADGNPLMKFSPSGEITLIDPTSGSTLFKLPSSLCSDPVLGVQEIEDTDNGTGIAFSVASHTVSLCSNGFANLVSNEDAVWVDTSMSLAIGGAAFSVYPGASQSAIDAQIDALGTTTRDGIRAINTTAAAAGAQQVSPTVEWIGQGWKTNVTAGSREVQFYSYVLPVQGSVLPTGTWRLGAQINSGARTDLLEVTSTGTVNILTATGLLTAGNQVGYNRSAYGVGTAYSFTNSAAAVDFGTTDPAIVLDKTGTYQICGQLHVAYAGATVATETATVKVRRTNNTAADLSAVVVIDLPVSTTLTHSYGTVQIPCFFYATAATDDAVTLFANVSAALGAGTINATAIGTSITAVRLY